MENNIKIFKDYLLSTYNKYPELFDYLNDTSYLKFLYSHVNEVEIVITTDYIKNDFIICKLLDINTKNNNNINNNYINNTITLYEKYLTDIEKGNIMTGKFYVYIFEKKFPDIKEEYDKYFLMKNRRDFLIPHFFHNLTIKTFSNFIIEDKESYKNLNSKFFKLLVMIRKYIKTKERIGVMLDSSITLSLHNIRKNNDIDLVVLHPKNDNPNIINNLNEIKKLDFVDAFFDNIVYWDGEDKNTLDRQTFEITEKKINNYFDLVFNPEYHFYFFGIKIISFDYDLKYRAMRRFPKNVADLLITKDKLKIPVPKIKKLESNIIVEKNNYTPEKFIKVVSNYLNRFNYKIDNLDKKIEELY